MKRNTETWTTRDGRTIPVREMTDDHLRNTCKMLLRKAWRIQFHDGLQLASAMHNINGDMAQYAAESDLDYMLQLKAGDYVRMRSDYAPLFAEANARGIAL